MGDMGDSGNISACICIGIVIDLLAADIEYLRGFQLLKQLQKLQAESMSSRLLPLARK